MSEDKKPIPSAPFVKKEIRRAGYDAKDELVRSMTEATTPPPVIPPTPEKEEPKAASEMPKQPAPEQPVQPVAPTPTPNSTTQTKKQDAKEPIQPASEIDDFNDFMPEHDEEQNEAPTDDDEKQADEQLSYTDDNTKVKDEATTFDDVLREIKNITSSDDFNDTNTDKLGLTMPLSSDEDMNATLERTFLENHANLDSLVRDATSDVRTILAATRVATLNIRLLRKALERLEEPSKKLAANVRSLCDSHASVFKKFEQEDRVVLSGRDGQVALTSLVGGIRRIRLYNSGISVNLRNLSLSTLNDYYREANADDFEYGKMFGAFYYLYSDLNITKYVIENLFPLMICGSNYKHWKDGEKLQKAISFQDFQTILWAASTMMHPEGVTVNFTCGEPGCGHVTRELVDLSKLRLMNLDLINDDMYAMMSKTGTISDEDLETYRKISDLNKSIEFEYGEGIHKKHWKLHLKQASLYDYVQTGEEYLDHLKKSCNISNFNEVYLFSQYNFYRVFKPWIDSAELTVTNTTSNKPQTYVFNNDGSDYMNSVLNDVLDEFQAENGLEFGEMMKQYILDTKITHICFYFPECPSCHTAPKMGYGGFVPYDTMQSFFTLALMKLLRAKSKYDTESTVRGM